MHIVCVTHAYPRWPGDVAGAFIGRLARALARLGHRISVVAPADGGEGGLKTEEGIAVRRVRYAPARFETLAYRGTMAEAARSPAGAAAVLALLAAQRRVIRRAAREGPALVHAHWWVPAGLSAWLAGFPRGPRYVVTLHGTDVAILGRSRGARAVARRVLGRAAAVTAVSSYLAERAAAAVGLDARQIAVQPMPADVARYTRRSDGGGGIVAVGRLVPQKRMRLVLQAVAHLAATGRSVPLTVVGDGPERGPLESEALRLGIADRARFTGAVEPERLPEVLADADVLAFPAAGEGYGLAAAEALLQGIPVVACRDGGGVTDVVPEFGAGRLVPPDDPPALAAGLAELLDDPGARAHAARHGDRLRERLDPDRVAAAFEAVYRRALARSDGRDA